MHRVSLPAPPQAGLLGAAVSPPVLPSLADRNRLSSLGYQLLLLDDQVLFCEGLRELFRTASMPVVVSLASSVDECLWIARQILPEVLVVNVALGEGCPWTAAGRIRQQHHSARVMYLDDRVRIANVRGVIRNEGHGYWTKRSSFSEIAAALAQIAVGGISFCPEVRALVSLNGGRLHSRRTDETRPLARLTGRELQVLELLGQGHSVKDCARMLQLAENTVDNHKARLMKKLGVHKIAHLVRVAVEEGLVR